MFRFAIGLAKKVLIANPMAQVATTYMDGPINDLSTPQAWIGILAYTFQIYFDFSGYSDMAIGLGKMMGFTFPENFNRPYISASITEFWRRWHITLGSWMRDYLYIPLGGNKKSKQRGFTNLTIVFLISGLWHGASWNFILWGAFHGIFLVLDRLFLLNTLARLPKLISVAFTFFVTILGWVIFRIEDMNAASRYYGKLFSAENLGHWPVLSAFEITIFGIAILLSFSGTNRIIQKWEGFSETISERLLPNFAKFSLTVILLVLSLSWLTTSSFNPFIYYRF